jgi:predicted PurR-regulated permease PerM
MNKPVVMRFQQPRGTTLIDLAVAALIIAALYFARDIFVPIALAVLLSFVLAPLITRLRALGIPNSASVLVVVIFGFAIIFSLAGLMVSEAERLAENLPRYQQTLHEKIESIRGLTAGPGTLEKASKVLRELNTELQSEKPGRSTALQESVDHPIPVEVRQPDPGALGTLVAFITPLISPLTTTGVVVVFVLFILFQRQDLRNRFVRLAGEDIHRTTAALDEAAERLSKLFLTQTLFNAGFGLIFGTGLHLIGIPSAPLWGLLAMIMRFVPYVGPAISAVFPVILAAAVGPGWQMLVLTIVLFAVLELVASQILEPLIFGHSSGLSPVALIASASFWTWLWGPIGLVMAIPLTVCLVVLGRHVERLQFLEIILGDEPPLTPPQLLYQRMLAGDPVEAAEQARIYLKDGSLERYYDEVLLESLELAKVDYRLKRLDEERLHRMVETVNEMMEDLESKEEGNDKSEAAAEIAEIKAAPQTDRMWASHRSIVCVPGTGQLDEIGAICLAHLLRRQGFGAEAEPADALSVSKLFSLDFSNVQLACVCFLDQPSEARARYVVRRLGKKVEPGKIQLLILNRSEAVASDRATSLEETLRLIERRANEAPVQLSSGSVIQFEAEVSGPAMRIAQGLTN